MFDKIKQLKKLKDLHSSLKKETMEVEKEGIKITINGNIQIVDIKLNPGMETDRQEKILRECINDAVKKIQFAMAQKMAQAGNLPDLGSLGM